ncbi:MAG TPA: flippase-like domain-containing protein [Candidatus Korarchaeota archaeon]|nr:flippase-like domain-containing protein [Candidatus Korarchaeota archaeon]
MSGLRREGVDGENTLEGELLAGLGTLKARVTTAVLGMAGLAALVLLFREADPQLLADAVSRIGWRPVLLSLLSFHAGFLLYTLGWYVLLGGRLSFRDAYLISWVGTLASLIIPAGPLSADATRTYLAHKRGGLGIGEAASSITAHRITMLMPFVVYVGGGSAYLLLSGMEGSEAGARALMLAGASGVLVIFGLLATTSERVLGGILRLAERLTRRDISAVRAIADDYLEGYARLRENLPLMVKVVAISLGGWLMDMMPILILLHALKPDFPLLAGVLVYSVNIIMLRLPLGIPGGNLGLREWASVGLLEALGLTREMAAAVTLVASDVIALLNQLTFGLLAYLIVLKEG